MRGETAESPSSSASIEYVCTDIDARGSGLLVLARTFGVPLLVGGWAAAWLSVSVGVLIMLCGPLVELWTRRHGFRTKLSLIVDNHRLEVSSSSGQLVAAVYLDELLDVELESREVQAVRDGGSSIPAMRIIEPHIEPPSLRSRIVLVTSSAMLRLATAYDHHAEAMSSMGKIRVFLRRHGWLPEDERPPSA